MCAELGETFEEVSIDDDAELAARYAEEIPVTFVDGRQHDFWRVDEAGSGRRCRDRPTALSASPPPRGGKPHEW